MDKIIFLVGSYLLLNVLIAFKLVEGYNKDADAGTAPKLHARC